MSTSSFWSRHVFVILSPDALYRDLQCELLERLRREGFWPVAARLVRADPEMIDELYADVIAGQWQTWRYRLVDATFDLGPALALICRYEGDGDQPHALLQERKGNQHPDLAAPGTIRRDFGAVNSILGLLHTSDGPVESEREAAVFGLAETDADPDPHHAAARVIYLCALAGRRTAKHRDFDQTLADVRARVIAAVWETLDAPVQEALHGAFPDPAGLSAPRAGARLVAILDGALPADVLEVLQCDFTPEWCDRIRMGRARRCFQRYGVGLDVWEQLVLESSLYFPPRRSRPGLAA